MSTEGKTKTRRLIHQTCAHARTRGAARMVLLRSRTHPCAAQRQTAGTSREKFYLVGGEGGSWSGGARLKALPSNMCICVRTSSMDGWELSEDESEPR